MEDSRQDLNPAGHADLWGRICARRYGLLLLAGFACPMLVHHGREAQTVWFGAAFTSDDSSVTVWALLPLVAGIVALLLGRFATGKGRAFALFVLGLGALCALVFHEAVLLDRRLTIPPELRFFFLTGILSAAAVAVGNRSRRLFHSSVAARWLCGLGGASLCLLLCMPIHEDGAIVVELIKPAMWTSAWPLGLVYLTLLIYGVLGVLNHYDLDQSDGLVNAVSLFARIGLVAVPLAFLIGMYPHGEPAGVIVEHRTTAVVLWVVKLTAVHYGAMFLMACGLAAWMQVRIWQRLEREMGQAARDEAAVTAPAGSGASSA